LRSHLAILFASIVIALLIAGSAVFAWQQNQQPSVDEQTNTAASMMRLPSAAGEIRFSHPSHGTARCADCHHQTADPNPYRACRDCHQPKSEKVLNTQEAFHQGCIQCHERRLKRDAFAPTRVCSNCHRK